MTTRIEPAALTIPLRPCAPWCQDGDGHVGEHPDDRSCWSMFHKVPLSLNKPVRLTSGEWWTDYLDVVLRWAPGGNPAGRDDQSRG